MWNICMKLHDINEVTFPPRLQNTHNSFGSVLGIYQEKFSCNVLLPNIGSYVKWTVESINGSIPHSVFRQTSTFI